MDKFVELLKESVITQWSITVLAMVLYGVLLIMGREVPSTLQDVVFAVVMFYFGSKLGVYQGRLSNRAKEVSQ